jgi:hypothetical protein
MAGKTFAIASSLVTAVLVALSCSSGSSSTGGVGTDGGTEGGSSSGVDGGSTLGGSINPPSQTGNQVVDRLGAAAATCGKQSTFTVPGGWQMVAIGEKGCVTWAPPGWVVSGQFTGLATAMKDQSGQEGFLGLSGATTTACEPPIIRDGVLDGYTAKGYAAPQVLWHHEQNDEFGGTAWPTGHTVFSSSVGGTPLVGYLWILTTQTVAACDVVGLGFWEPVASIETNTCTLTQIINSVKCGGASCDDGDCNTVCKNDGKAGGSCGSASSCECY